MKIAYFDCFSGISGDMVLGALIDLGAPFGVLLDELKKLPVEGYAIRTVPERRGAIGGTRVKIHIEPQPHRTFADIRNLIRSSGLNSTVQEKSLAVFERLAEAEARVHHVEISEVHFHEVGALDSILDVVGSIIALDLLGIEKVYASKLPIGRGFVHTEHGMIPIPAPATVHLLAGVPVYDNGVERELVTPTGAGILTTLTDSFGPVPEMVLLSTGYGVGSHPASNPPNLLRVLLGTSSAASLLCSRLVLMETSIDDMNPEFYNYILEELFTLGVLDVNIVPVQMKKNRPGILLRVLSHPTLQASVLELLFKETSTLGVRIQEVKRVELQRETKIISTPYGPCRVKSVIMPEGEERMIPEFEECKRIARSTRMPLRKVYEDILLAAGRELADQGRSNPMDEH